MPDYSSTNGNQFSQFVGIVLEDKESDSRVIKVYLKEMLPFVTGDVRSIDDPREIGNELTGYKGSATTTNTVEATYIGNPNRAYPPDIRKNEQVWVWKYADADDYYWDAIGRDDNLRGPERLNFRISGAPGPIAALTDENTYCIELDTKHHKRVLLRTSKANGEEYAYFLALDPENNRFVVCDDSNNEILIDSELPRVRMRNRDGSIIDLAQKSIIQIAPEDILMKAGRQLVLDIPVITTSNTTGDGTTVWKANNLLLKADGTAIIEAQCVGIKGAMEADTIVAKNVQAESYSTGAGDSTYGSPTTDVENGRGSTPNNSPNTGGGGAANRHCSAWEQVSQALTIIASCMDQLGCPQADAVRALAQESIMNKNRGE